MSADLWVRIAGAALVVLVLFGAGFGVRGHYASKEMAAEKDREHQDDLRRRKEVSDADAATAARESKAAHENSDLRAAYVIVAAAASAADSRHVADLAAGRVGVRVRLVPGSCDATAVPVSDAASGADGAPTARLDPAVAASVERIANTGDDAIRQLTALQDWVDRNVRNANAGSQPAHEVTP